MRETGFRIAIGQIPSVRADVDSNLDMIERQVHQADENGVEVLVFPELALPGYLVDDRFANVALKLDDPRMDRLRELSRDVDLVVGFIEETPSALFYNSSVHLSRGRILHLHRKIYLPTYGKFDERRYFGAGWQMTAYDTNHLRSAMLICGDAWHLPLPYLAAHSGADVLMILAASSREGLSDTTPSEQAWRWMCSSYALTLSCFVVFANLAEGDNNGDYTFYGGSFIAGPSGLLIAESSKTTEDQLICDLEPDALRKQRIKLPFRRDDSLSHTIELSKRVLASKVKRDKYITEQTFEPPVAPKPR